MSDLTELYDFMDAIDIGLDQEVEDGDKETLMSVARRPTSVPSHHASSPEEVGGFFFDFEAVRCSAQVCHVSHQRCETTDAGHGGEFCSVT